MSSSGLQELPDGPLDLVGDVHGEYDALVSLLKKLGYDDLEHLLADEDFVGLRADERFQELVARLRDP